MKVAIGGTFQPLHDGHKLLLRTAYELGGQVDIGLTSDKMARNSRVRNVEPYEERERKIREWVKKEFNTDPRITKIDDPYGSTLADNYDYIVVSPETYNTAIKINELRKAKGMKSIAIVRVDYVLAEDGRPISSTRIVSGDIDQHGNLLRKEKDESGSGNN